MDRPTDNLAQGTKTNETTNERIFRSTNNTTRHIATKFKVGDLKIQFQCNNSCSLGTQISPARTLGRGFPVSSGKM